MADDQVGWIRDLDAMDAALVRAFRNAAVALGHGCGVHEARTRGDIGGITHSEGRSTALRSFWALMSTIGTHAHRQIRFHAPDCSCLGEDEAVFLRICADLRTGDRRRASSRAAFLVPADAAARVVHHAEAIASLCRGTTDQRPEQTRDTPAPATTGMRLH